MSNEVAYLLEWDEICMERVPSSPLRPTGRWKIVTCFSGEKLLYVEHRGWLFKSWIKETDIKFGYERNERIFECERSQR